MFSSFEEVSLQSNYSLLWKLCGIFDVFFSISELSFCPCRQSYVSDAKFLPIRSSLMSVSKLVSNPRDLWTHLSVGLLDVCVYYHLFYPLHPPSICSSAILYLEDTKQDQGSSPALYPSLQLSGNPVRCISVGDVFYEGVWSIRGSKRSKSLRLCPSFVSVCRSSICLPMSWGHVEAGDHHEVSLAEVDSGLQFVRHVLQSLQILQGVHFVGLLKLN